MSSSVRGLIPPPLPVRPRLGMRLDKEETTADGGLLTEGIATGEALTDEFEEMHSFPVED